MRSIRKKLVLAFGIEQEYSAVLITGSGTAALEMAVSSCLTPGRSMLVVQNGLYGERISKMAAAYQMDKHALNYDTYNKVDDDKTAYDNKRDEKKYAKVRHS